MRAQRQTEQAEVATVRSALQVQPAAQLPRRAATRATAGGGGVAFVGAVGCVGLRGSCPAAVRRGPAVVLRVPA